MHPKRIRHIKKGVAFIRVQRAEEGGALFACAGEAASFFPAGFIPSTG